MAEPPEDCLTGLIEHIREVFGLDTCGTTEFKFEPRSTIMMPAAPKVNANGKNWKTATVWFGPLAHELRDRERSAARVRGLANLVYERLPRTATIEPKAKIPKPRRPEGVIAQDLVDQKIEELATLNNVTKTEMKKWYLKGMTLWEELGYVASKNTQSPPTVKYPFLSVPRLSRILHRKMSKRERIGRSEDQVTPSIRRCFGSYCTVRLFPATRRSRLWRMRNGGMC
jgi:hypothetical protein